MEATSFISAKMASKLLNKLTKTLKNSIDKRNQELIRINDVFGDCEELAKFYIQPNCQQVNPADELEDETISSIRARAFETIDNFFKRDIVVRDGASQMFILADAGMGKTSLLMMIKLSHLMAFWPKDYQCELLKLGTTTLGDINKIKNKSKTILLLDSLDEDNQCKQGGTSERLTKILEETTGFYRVIITCRTQFFPETARSAFHTMGKISFNSYDCPLVYLSLFDNDQVDTYLEKRYPKSLKYISNRLNNPKKNYAKQAISSINSLQFRPFLLSHVETLLESYRQGATEYHLYKGLVETWLNREVIKLRKHHNRNVSKGDLLKACVWLAETMQRQNTHTVALKHLKQLCHRQTSFDLLEDPAERVIEGINHIDIGTSSLLNRNSYGEFRFSHLSIREFLIIYGIELGIIKDKDDPFSKTDKMLSFIKTVNQIKIGLFFNEKNGYLLTGFEIINSDQLTNMDLKNASLEHSSLENASLNNMNLEGANLNGANLKGASLLDTNLKSTSLQEANLEEANLEGANLKEANLQEANLNNAQLNSANLSYTNLTKANMEGANLEKSNLRNSKPYEASLTSANLTKTDLNNADVKGSKLIEANLEQADLTKADFRGADLTNSNLSRAILTGTELTKAYLAGSNISDEQRKEAVFRKYENKNRKEELTQGEAN